MPHAMQAPLKAELDKLCNEGILHKVDIPSPLNGSVHLSVSRKAMGKSRNVKKGDNSTTKALLRMKGQ